MTVAMMIEVSNTVILQDGQHSATAVIRDRHCLLTIRNSEETTQINVSTSELIAFAEKILVAHARLLNLQAANTAADR